MNTIIKPVGPHDKTVYWRRRAIAVVLLLVVVLLLGLFFRAVFSSGGTDTPNATTTSTAAATSPNPTVSGEVSKCVASVLRLEALTGEASYPAGVSPILTLSLSNTGSSDCLVDVGTSQQEFLILSGNDRIWSSRDCQVEPADNELVIRPGENKKATVTWNLSRSAPGCPAGLPAAVAGTYIFTVSLGSLTSAETRFVLQ